MTQTSKITSPGTQITITLPPGITPEMYRKSYQSWETAKIKSNKAMKADWRALSALRKAHPEEYLKLRIEEWKKEGLDPSNLKTRK